MDATIQEQTHSVYKIMRMYKLILITNNDRIIFAELIENICQAAI